MSHGGVRNGSGRKLNPVKRRSFEAAERAFDTGMTPLDFMLAVMRDEGREFKDRFEAAKAAAPYVHARLTSAEVGGVGGGALNAVVKVVIDDETVDRVSARLLGD